jgi:polysaccharide biosynthesis protein PslH
MEKKMKILFITNLLPYPLDNGGKIKTFHTIQALSKNNDVDLVTFVNSSSEKKNRNFLNGICNNVEVIEKIVIMKSSKLVFVSSFIKSLFSKYPYVVSKFYSTKMSKKIRELQNQKNYDLIYVDHLQMMIYKKELKSPIILDQHNVESKIIERLAQNQKSIIKKIIGHLEYKKLFVFEKKALSHSTKTIALSSTDRNELIKINENASDIEIVPICIPQNFLKNTIHQSSGTPLKLLFVGTLTWYPNYQGLKWFIENVFLKLDMNKYELFVVGGNPPEDLTKHDSPNIHFTGYVDSIDEYIEKCDINIVPLFVGSGLRVKIIEAFAKGIPNISTTIGAEGLAIEKDKNIFIEDTAKGFMDLLCNLYENRQELSFIANNGLNTYKKNYSLKTLEEKLNKITKSITEVENG